MHLLTIGLLGAAVCLVAQIVANELGRRRTQREARCSSIDRITEIMDTYRTAPRGALTQDEVNEIVREYAASRPAGGLSPEMQSVADKYFGRIR